MTTGLKKWGLPLKSWLTSMHRTRRDLNSYVVWKSWNVMPVAEAYAS